jgi:hypothetical protein
MELQTRRRKIIESLVLAGLPVAANLVFPGDPGFLGAAGVPYLATGVLFTAFYGLAWGGWVAALSGLAGFLLLPGLEGRLGVSWPAALSGSLAYSAPLALLAWLGAGFAHRRQTRRTRAFLAHLRGMVHRQVALRRKADGLDRVNRILEGRVANQKDSITLLRSQVQRLSSLNLEQALESMLESVRLFTETRSASVWTLDPEHDCLRAAAVAGWGADLPRSTVRGLDDSIEGYVFRNGKQFSIRMVMGSQEFNKFDVSANILCYPIKLRGRTWGVLNIEDLPFERYSLYTESVLEILISLVEPNLADIIDHEALFDQREVDADTGLPEVTQLYRTLERDLGQLGRDGEGVSLVVLEISNFNDLLAAWGRAQLKCLLPEIKSAIDQARNMKIKAFKFKQDNQMALVVGGLDQDGTSFLCLEILSMVPGLGLAADGRPVPIELIIGFSSSRDAGNSPDAMIRAAESLLEMQRL